MALDSIAGWGAIFLAVLIAATTYFKLPKWLYYVAAGLAVIWGVVF